jgi:hypothetical protein
MIWSATYRRLLVITEQPASALIYGLTNSLLSTGQDRKESQLAEAGQR